MKVALYGKTLGGENRKAIQEIISVFDEKSIQYCVHNNLINAFDHSNINVFNDHSSLPKDVDFLISIGGDGTFLDTILLVRDSQIPVLGINTGRLGFLSNTPKSEISKSIHALLNHEFEIEKRSMLKLESEQELFGEDNFALNEISISKSDSSSMITIHTELNGNHLNSYWTDGLIISTATGSTAYSLSCGGPIMMPGSGNFVITPIAPHNLNVRPIVVDDHAVLKLSVESRSERNLVALDSRSMELQSEVELKIQKADYKISIVLLKNNSFINSLRNKLNWGLDQRNS